MKKQSLNKLINISMAIAIAVVLDLVKEMLPFLNMPSGGSINISLIPIVLISFILDYRCGLIAGFIWFLITSILGLNPYYLNIGQYFLDYIFSSTIVGLSSVFYKKNLLTMELGIVFVMFLRTLSIIISGAYFWVDDVNARGSIASIIGSISYNLPYSLATLIMLMIIVPIVHKSVKRFIK